MKYKSEKRAYVAMRMRHITRTQHVFGLVNAWSDFFTYLGEAMIFNLGGGK